MKTIQTVPQFHLTHFCFAQQSPWAQYNQEEKDRALDPEASQGNLEELKSIVASGQLHSSPKGYHEFLLSLHKTHLLQDEQKSLSKRESTEIK